MTAASGFMPLLEAYGLSAGVAAWTLATACRAATTWTSGQISVQVEPCALNDGSLLGLVGQALADSGLDAERLELEFAEPALAACTAETLFTLASLRDLGVCVALEAFGSESANLLPLKHLPVTALKLDRSLVRDLPEDRDAGAIIRAATDFAHALGVTVVACGLESPAQLAALRAAGCDEGQGSLCGRAVAEGDW
jgi:EAL domain-containing protein (putative c-di-GMP-specific phosphodiesterase class I)